MRSSVLIATFGRLNLILYARRLKLLVALHAFMLEIYVLWANYIRDLQDECGTGFVERPSVSTAFCLRELQLDAHFSPFWKSLM
jgi:hypothetical protein